MQIIARMNVGGPAVIVADHMRGLKTTEMAHKLETGFCATDEPDYVEQVPKDENA